MGWSTPASCRFTALAPTVTVGPIYAMRFVRGDSLKEAIDHFHADEVLKKRPRHYDAGTAQAAAAVPRRLQCDRLRARRGVLHRDIKPGNIIVGKHGETLVVDWGLAKAMGGPSRCAAPDERPLMPSSSSGSSETLPGSALGTPAYMSPEQARGDLDTTWAAVGRVQPGRDPFLLADRQATGREPGRRRHVRAVQEGDLPATASSSSRHSIGRSRRFA